jgi:hypothetical protein
LPSALASRLLLRRAGLRFLPMPTQPSFPADLERELFETTALMYPNTIPTLLQVARRILIWYISGPASTSNYYLNLPLQDRTPALPSRLLPLTSRDSARNEIETACLFPQRCSPPVSGRLDVRCLSLYRLVPRGGDRRPAPLHRRRKLRRNWQILRPHPPPHPRRNESPAPGGVSRSSIR